MVPSVTLIDVICSSGLDFVVIDGEHGPVGMKKAQEMTIACEANKVSPIVRVPGVDQDSVLRALEIGSHGIQVPNVNSVDQLARLKEYSKYTPDGNRGLSPFTRASKYSSDWASLMVEQANDNTLTIVHIEGELGAKNIDDLLNGSVGDIFFLGLYDISNYLGHRGDVTHPEVLSLFKRLSVKILDAGKIVGSISNDLDQLSFMVENGVRYITHSVDCHVISSAYREVVSNIKG